MIKVDSVGTEFCLYCADNLEIEGVIVERAGTCFNCGRERERAMNCEYCKEESNKEMCDHCAEAEEAGVLDDYLSGKVKCPACVRALGE